MERFRLDPTNHSTHSIIPTEAVLSVQDYLTQFSLSEKFIERIKIAFGDRLNSTKLEELRQQWATGNFEALPEIEIRPAAEINGAIGAFSADTNRIYLSQEYIAQNASNSQVISNVLLEEIGHFVDTQINVSDVPGDEGAIFSALTQSKQLGEPIIQRLKTENDKATIALDGQLIQVEQASNDVTISGTIQWTDNAGRLHPVREATVIVKDEGPGGTFEIVRTVRTELNQKGEYTYTATFNNNDVELIDGRTRLESKRDIYIEVLADGPTHFVEGVGAGFATTYSQKTSTINEISNGLHNLPITIGNDTNAERAFAVSDALYIGGKYAEVVRGKTRKLEVNFPIQAPAANFDEGRFFGKDVNITSRRREAWDVILHEYSHFLADEDVLDADVFGEHSAGQSNITAIRGKEKGVQLAWSEGLATYLGLAVQAVQPKLLPTIPGIGNTKYDSIDLDNPANSFSFDIESTADVGNIGEGDESSVRRILWDIADEKNEPHDQIEIGHKRLYNILNNEIPEKSLDRLDDVWDFFFNDVKSDGKSDFLPEMSKDTERVKFGAIFEEYGVSPKPTGNVIDQNFPELKNDLQNVPVSTFTWERKNNNANDKFSVIIFNNNFSQRVVEGKPLGDVTTWTPSQDEWKKILKVPGEYHFVVVGSDTDSPETGPYWSGERTFTVGNVNLADKREVPRESLNQGLAKLDEFQSQIDKLLAGTDGVLGGQEGLPFLGTKLAPSDEASSTVQTSQALISSEGSDTNVTSEASAEFIASDISDINAAPGIQELQFLRNLSTRIREKLNTVKGNTVDDLQKAFFEVLGSNGSFGSSGILQDLDGNGRITQADIKTSPVDDPEIKFNMKLGGKVASVPIQLPESIGLPKLGFQFGEPNDPNSRQATIDLDFNFDFGFGINKDKKFFFDVSSPDDITFSLKPSFPDATARLGFLKIQASDEDSQGKGTELKFNAHIDDGTDDDGRLTLDDELNDLTKLDDLVTSDGSAEINLHFNTGLDTSLPLPQIEADLNLKQTLGEDKASAPTIALNNVTLDAGSFVNSFVSPVLEEVNSIVAPVKPIVDVLDKDLPIIGRSLIELASDLAPALKSKDPQIEEKVKKSIEFIKQIQNLSKLLETIPKDGSFEKIPLGSFNLTGDDVLNSDLKDLKATQTSEVLTQSGSTTSDPVSSFSLIQDSSDQEASSSSTSKFIAELKKKGENDIQFPILTNPLQALDLLRGKEDVELFKYTTPELDFNLIYDKLPPIPVFGPIVLQFQFGIGAGAQFAFGFDSRGLIEFKNSGFDEPDKIFDGFFVGKPSDNPNLFLEGEIDAVLAAKAGIANVEAGGGINATFGLSVKGGKQYFDEIIAQPSPLCIFDPSGTLSAIIFASIELDFGFFSFTKRFSLANINLIDFSQVLESDRCDPTQQHFDVEDPEPDAKTQAKLAEIGIIDRKGTDDDNIITVLPRNNDFPQDLRLVGLDPDPGKDYDKVKLIVLNGGKGNDSIKFDPSVKVPGQLYGAEGNDTLTGGAGIDFLSGGQGNDTLDGGSDKKNTAVYTDSPNGVTVDLATETANDGYGTVDKLINIQNVEGSQKNDMLTAIAALPDGRGSVLDAGDGNDTLKGGTGNDILLGGLGADFMDGASGIDTTTYINSNASVYINPSDQDVTILSPLNGVSTFLPAHQGKGGEAEGDQIFNVENVHGSIYDDILVASNSIPQERVGHVGGFLGNDIIFAGSGKDELDGDQGIDWLSYRLSDSDEGVNVSLKTGGSRPEKFIFPGQPDLSKLGRGGYAEGDQIQTVKIGKEQNDQPFKYSSFENLEGSDRDDTLEGNESEIKDNVVILNGNNIIRGLAGKDTLYGLSGNDTLIGGADGDYLDGGLESGLRVGTLQAKSDRLQDEGDTASYEDAPSPVSVNLLTKSGSEGEAAGDTFNEIENLLGSAYGDTLIGDDTANDINPGLQNAGIDVVDGGDGTDRLTINYSLTRTTGSLGAVGGFNTGTLTRGNSRVLFSNIERLYIVGTSKRDELVGGSEGDVLLTALGDDLVDGGRGHDIIRTDEGDDEVVDQLVNDQFVTDPENSRIILDGGSGIDMLSVDLSSQDKDIQLIGTDPHQEDSNQALSFSDGSVITGFEVFRKIKTGRGNDTVIQLGRQFNDWMLNNVFYTEAGNDTVNPGLGIDLVDGGIDGLDPDGILEGDDKLVLDYSSEKIGTGVFVDVAKDRFGESNASQGGRFYRNVSGTDQTRLDEVTFSNFERFNISGTDQSDRLVGGDREDTLQGNAGNDNLIGNSGNDQVFGGDGKDFVVGGVGDDSLDGGEGDDFLTDGDDSFAKEFFSYRSGGDDRFTGGSGNDTLHSRSGNDQLIGEDGDDRLFGDDGNDILNGGSGDDTLEGAELFSSRDEIDTLTGGTGADVFVIGNEFSSFYFDESSDGGTEDYALITDFNPLEGDRIRIHQCHPGGYELRVTPEGLPEGIAIYGYYNDLIAIVQGASNLGELGFLAPGDHPSYFTAVGDCLS